MKKDSIIITGTAFEAEIATVALRPEKIEANGMDVAVSVTVLEFEFKVKTFFYGYNFEQFFQQNNQPSSGDLRQMILFNYDETLKIEFICRGDLESFVAIYYRSALPEAPPENFLSTLRPHTSAAEFGGAGSRFHMCYMKLHSPFAKTLDDFKELVRGCALDNHNPYPGGA